MTLAFVVYFGLLVALVICWAYPARAAVAGPTVAAHVGTQAAIVSVFVFSVLIGGRYNVGGDYFGYIDYYHYTSFGDTPADVVFEPGFLFLIQFLKLFALPDRSIIVASSFLQILLLSLWLRKHPQIAPFVVFAFITLLLLDVDNIVRQGIALFAILLALSTLNERQWFRFLLWTVFAYLFHRSAIIILPLGMALVWFRTPQVALQIVALVLSYLTVGLFLDQVVGLFTVLSPLFGYSGYSDVSRADLAFSKTITSSFNVGVYLWPVVDAVIILYSRRLMQRYGVMGYAIYHNLFLIAALLQPVANSWNFLPFARALFYFTAMRAICIGFLLHYCLIDARRPREILVATSLSMAFLLWLAVAVARGAAWSAPYQFS